MPGISLLQISSQLTAENCWKWAEVATASWGHCERMGAGKNWRELVNSDKTIGSGIDEDIALAVTGTVEMTKVVVSVKVHEFEETGDVRREDIILLRLGYASVEGG